MSQIGTEREVCFLLGPTGVNFTHSSRGPQDGTSRDGTVLVPAVREDVRGRGLPGLGIGRGRGRPRTANFNFHGTSEDEDVQDGERDGDEDDRGRQFLRLV